MRTRLAKGIFGQYTIVKVYGGGSGCIDSKNVKMQKKIFDTHKEEGR